MPNASCVLALVLSFCAAPALAQETPVSFGGEIGVVSDYRFRGLSLSDEEPALQGGLTASHESGVYAYVWASTIADYAGADIELDYAVGWAGTLGGLEADISVQLFTYPGAHDVAYLEIPASVSRQAGALRWTLGGAYAPAQDALGDEDNVYGFGALAWETKPANFELRVGYEDGAYAPLGKWDWSAGASRAFGPLTAGVAYVDSDAAGSGVVASLTASF